MNTDHTQRKALRHYKALKDSERSGINVLLIALRSTLAAEHLREVTPLQIFTAGHCEWQRSANYGSVTEALYAMRTSLVRDHVVPDTLLAQMCHS